MVIRECVNETDRMRQRGWQRIVVHRITQYAPKTIQLYNAAQLTEKNIKQPQTQSSYY